MHHLAHRADFLFLHNRLGRIRLPPSSPRTSTSSGNRSLRSSIDHCLGQSAWRQPTADNASTCTSTSRCTSFRHELRPGLDGGLAHFRRFIKDRGPCQHLGGFGTIRLGQMRHEFAAHALAFGAEDLRQCRDAGLLLPTARMSARYEFQNVVCGFAVSVSMALRTARDRGLERGRLPRMNTLHGIAHEERQAAVRQRSVQLSPAGSSSRLRLVHSPMMRRDETDRRCALSRFGVDVTCRRIDQVHFWIRREGHRMRRCRLAGGGR